MELSRPPSLLPLGLASVGTLACQSLSPSVCRALSRDLVSFLVISPEDLGSCFLCIVPQTFVRRIPAGIQGRCEMWRWGSYQQPVQQLSSPGGQAHLQAECSRSIRVVIGWVSSPPLSFLLNSSLWHLQGEHTPRRWRGLREVWPQITITSQHHHV